MTDYINGQYLFSNDMDAILDSFNGEGIISGLVTSVSSGLTLSVASGVVWVNGTKVTKATSTSVVISAADSLRPRKDIIVINSSGTISVVAGTADYAVPTGKTGVEALRPVPPEITTNNVLLSEVYVPAAATSIVSGNITDRRIILGTSVIDNAVTVHSALTTGVHGVTGTVVGTSDSQTLSNKILTTPTIGDFTNANHTHAAVGSTGGVIDSANITNTPAGNIVAVTSQAAINELDTEKVAKAGDTMTSTLIIDPATDVNSLKIVPPNDTATSTGSIVLRNSTNVSDAFRIDNVGNIVTVGTVDGVDISAHAGASSSVHGVTGTVIGTSDIQELSNKTIGNTNTITLKDNLFTIQQDDDATRQAQFQASGITAGQTRIITLQDSNITMESTTGSQNKVDTHSVLTTGVHGVGVGAVVGTTLTQGLTNKTYNKITVTEPAVGSTLTIVDGKTLTVSDTASVSGTNTGDQTASTVSNTPAGNITAVTVQAAINELDTEKVAKAGDTMTGDLEFTGVKKTIKNFGTDRTFTTSTFASLDKPAFATYILSDATNKTYYGMGQVLGGLGLISNDNAGGNIIFYTGNLTSTGGTSAERMRITSDGKVGIGNTPSQALDVTGNIAVSGTVDGVDISTFYGSMKSGSGKITAGNTFVDITHNSPSTPTAVIVTAKEAEGVDHFVNTVGATTFRINMPVSQIVDTNFYWFTRV
jgi:hypothetical protein